MTLPGDMPRVDEKTEIILFIMLIVFALLGNVHAMVSLLKRRRRHIRVENIFMHITCGHLIVALLMLPLEISSKWLAGDIFCRLLLLVKSFAFHLSSMLMVCINLDRYFTIVNSGRIVNLQRRTHILLGIAWTSSFLFSLPPSVIFIQDDQAAHCVQVTDYSQRAYHMFSLVTLYFGPLVIIIFTYLRIFWTLCNNTLPEAPRAWPIRLPRKLSLVQTKMLKLTVAITVLYLSCWTPYIVADICHFSTRRPLFFLAVLYCCLTPLLYGWYTLTFYYLFRNVCRMCRAQQGVQERYDGGDCLELRQVLPVNRPALRRPALRRPALRRPALRREGGGLARVEEATSEV